MSDKIFTISLAVFMSEIDKEGTYGFIVNVMCEFITIISLPFLRRISMGAHIVLGVIGDMDTMLASARKFVGLILNIGSDDGMNY